MYLGLGHSGWGVCHGVRQGGWGSSLLGQEAVGCRGSWCDRVGSGGSQCRIGD